MNAALVQWLMAPEAPGDLEVFLAQLVDRPAWHRQAACRGMGVDVFFPGRGEQLKVRAAKAICEGCAVRHECLEAALANGDLGIWGGRSERGRRGLKQGSAA
jgi:WhiB family redox-sensing transcriptional regulator